MLPKGKGIRLRVASFWYYLLKGSLKHMITLIKINISYRLLSMSNQLWSEKRSGYLILLYFNTCKLKFQIRPVYPSFGSNWPPKWGRVWRHSWPKFQTFKKKNAEWKYFVSKWTHFEFKLSACAQYICNHLPYII